MRIWLDDERPPPDGWLAVRTAPEAIRMLAAGAVTEISLDHDIGPPAAGSGYDVLLWIERAVVERGFRPPALRVHSANPVGRARMEQAISAIQRLATPPDKAS
jgi:hypothetical protein